MKASSWWRSRPQALDRYFSGEEERWRKVIQDAGIKIE